MCHCQPYVRLGEFALIRQQRYAHAGQFKPAIAPAPDLFRKGDPAHRLQNPARFMPCVQCIIQHLRRAQMRKQPLDQTVGLWLAL